MFDFFTLCYLGSEIIKILISLNKEPLTNVQLKKRLDLINNRVDGAKLRLFSLTLLKRKV